MAKKGMRRYDDGQEHSIARGNQAKSRKNEVEPVPELQGKAKESKKKANPL